MGWLDRVQGAHTVTTRGKELLQSKPGSKNERELMFDAFRSSPIGAALRPNFANANKAMIEAALLRHPEVSLAPSTIEKRAAALLKWRNFLVEPETRQQAQLQIPGIIVSQASNLPDSSVGEAEAGVALANQAAPTAERPTKIKKRKRRRGQAKRKERDADHLNAEEQGGDSVDFPEHWIYQILENEISDGRFELFANDVVTVLEGRPILPTSRSWDLGRDGRTASPGHGVYVLSSLRKDFSDKAREDAERLRETTSRIRRVYFYSSQRITDYATERIRGDLQGIFGLDVDVDAYGSTQLVGLVQEGKVRSVFEKHYSSEIAALKFLCRPVEDDSPHIQGLQLALATFTSGDVGSLREALYQNLIIQLLANGPLSSREMLDAADRMFGMRCLTKFSVEHHCKALTEVGCIESVGPRFRLTGIGESRLDALRAAQRGEELRGGQVVRHTVETSLGMTLTNDHWGRIWSSLQTGLANAFYSRGKEIVALVSALAEGQEVEGMREGFADLLDRTIVQVVSRTCQSIQRKQFIRALRDAFLPGDPSGAFEFLADLASKFVALCTLGFPQEVQAVLERTFSQFRFVFDTDVLIAWFCQHEPGHDAAKAVYEIAMRLKRPIFIPGRVAEETARHATKAYPVHRDQVQGRRGELRWFEVQELQSAFAREFEYLRLEGHVHKRQWPKYIQRYAGALNLGRDGLVPDIPRMRRLLSAEHFVLISHDSPETRDLRSRLAAQLGEHRLRRFETSFDYFRDRKIEEEKAKVDADLLIAVANAICKSEQTGLGERFLLISSANVMKRLPRESVALLGTAPEVITLPEAAVLVSLLPGPPLSLRALRSMLFEGEFHEAVSPLQNRVLTVLRSSDSVEIPGASRGILLEEFKDQLLRSARASGRDVQTVQREIEDDPLEFARYAAAAVDALGLQNAVDREEVLATLQELKERREPASQE